MYLERVHPAFLTTLVVLVSWEVNARVIVITSMQKFGEKNCLFWLIYGYLQVKAESAPPPLMQHPRAPPPLRLRFKLERGANVYWLVEFFMLKSA